MGLEPERGLVHSPPPVREAWEGGKGVQRDGIPGGKWAHIALAHLPSPPTQMGKITPPWDPSAIQGEGSGLRSQSPNPGNGELASQPGRAEPQNKVLRR